MQQRPGTIAIIFLAIISIALFAYTLRLNAIVKTLKVENSQLTDANVELNVDLEQTRYRVEQLESRLQTPNSNGSQPKFAYLTFDDGPSANTARILDILQQYNVKATFFVIGDESATGKNLYKRIVEEGHAIGLHCYSHDYSQIYKSEEAFMSNIYKLRDLIRDTTGVTPNILRFPGGSNTGAGAKYGGKGTMARLRQRVHAEGMQFFDWNVSSQDATKPVQSTNVIINSTLRGAKYHDHAIILMHDAPIKKTTVEALPTIIEGLQEQGFRFEVLKVDTPPPSSLPTE